MEFIMSIFVNPVGAALFGWLAWNAILFRVEKDGYDKKGQSFSFKKYASETYDNWIASLFLIPVLIFFGSRQLAIDLDAQHINWSDAYYVASGFFTELIMVAWEKWRNKNKSV